MKDATAPNGGIREWTIISTATPSAAWAAARATGLHVTSLISVVDLLPPSWARLAQLRRAGRQGGLLIHSQNWERQPYAPAFLALLGLVPGEKLLLDDRNGQSKLESSALRRQALCLPLDGARTATAVGRDAIRVARPLRPRVLRDRRGDRKRVIAIWRGGDIRVGGSVTHISGILGGFRHLGMQVLLVTSVEPPPQLAAVVDDVVVVGNIPARARLTRDTLTLAAARALRVRGMEAARQFGADLVYQRYEYLLDVGPDIARDLQVPFVLEWNGSELWANKHWAPDPLDRLTGPIFTRLATATERRLVVGCDLLAAVSEAAATMAADAGADPRQVRVIPNGVDLAAVAASPVAAPTGPRSPTLGWIGSFGPWHGAEVAIKALAHLPGDVRLVLIGDGRDRAACERLANDHGVAARIEFAGSLPHAEAVGRLAECEVLLSPHVPLADTPFFGSPTKLFEYLALAKPIVASRLGQIAEVIDDGRTGRLVEPGDPAALARAVADILASDDGGRSLGMAARKEAEERHGWHHRAATILTALDDLCPSPFKVV